MPVCRSDIPGPSEALVRVREPGEAYKYDQCNMGTREDTHHASMTPLGEGRLALAPRCESSEEHGALWVILLINSFQRILMFYDYLALSLTHCTNYCSSHSWVFLFSPQTSHCDTRPPPLHLISLVTEPPKLLLSLKALMIK